MAEARRIPELTIEVTLDIANADVRVTGTNDKTDPEGFTFTLPPTAAASLAYKLNEAARQSLVAKAIRGIGPSPNATGGNL